MNELLIWILAATLVVGAVLLVWLGRRRQQRARDATARREAHRAALEHAEHVARAQRLAAEREHASAEPAPLAGAVEALRLAEQARSNTDAGREGADITRRIAEGEATRIARDQAQHADAQEAERAELAERQAEQQAREQAERDAAAAAEAAAIEAAAAARRAEEAEAARVAAEAQAREEAERLAREAAERAAAEAAARQAAEAEAARLAAEAREQEEREQQAREQAEREAAQALEAARLAQEARERAEREAAAEAARMAAEAQAQAEAEAARAAAVAAATRELRADETLVLVADDSKIVRVKLSRLLASQGYRAALAESGEQALEMLAAERPHLLITDVEMPGIDGFELTRQLRAAPATAALPIVMITSSDDKQEQARAAGVTKLLGKPYAEDALIAAIEQARLAVRVPA